MRIIGPGEHECGARAQIELHIQVSPTFQRRCGFPVKAKALPTPGFMTNLYCSLLTQTATRQRKNNIFILRQAMFIRVSSAARRHRSRKLAFLLSCCCIELPQSQQSFISSISQSSLTCLTRRFLSVGGGFFTFNSKTC